MAELDEAARQERRQRAGEFLRAADRLYKAADFEGAARNVKLAMEADPQNPYAKAFEERILHAIAKKSKPRPEDAPAAATTPSIQHPGSAETLSRLPVTPPAAAKVGVDAEAKAAVDQELQEKLDEALLKLHAERAIAAELAREQEVLRTKYKHDELRWKEVEAQLRKQLDEQRRQLDNEKGRLVEAEQEKAVQEMKRLEESLRARFKEEARAKIEEETNRARQEESRKLVAERERIEKELRARFDEERRALEEQYRKERDALTVRLQDKDAEAKNMREEDRRALEQDRAALDADRTRLLAEIATQRAELQQQRLELQQQEDDLRRRLEEQFRQRVTEERARLDEEMRKYLEVERLRLENKIRQQTEVEAAKRRETEQIAQYEEEVKRAIEEGRRLAQGKKLKMYTEKARDLVVRGEFELALKEVTKAFLLDPEHEEAQFIERAIYAARQERIRREEEMARLQADQEAKMREIQRKLEEQAKRDREEEDRRAANAAKLVEAFRKASVLFEEGSYTKALREIETILAIDPGNPNALDLELNILNAMKKQEEAKAISQQRTREVEARKREEELKEKAAAEKRESLRRESLVTYRGMLKRAWLGGQPAKEQKSMLEVVRRSLAVGEDDHMKLEREVQLETYTEALRSAWKSGIISTDDVDTHENLRQLYGIGREEHLVIEAGILQELKRAQERERT